MDARHGMADWIPSDSAGGAAEAALGNLTGNESLKQQGESLKQAGTEELKAYQSNNPADPSSLSTKIGSAAGCEPLQEAESGASSSSGTAGSASTGSVSAASGVGGVIKDDGSVNSGLKDILGGGDQPGKPVSRRETPTARAFR